MILSLLPVTLALLAAPSSSPVRLETPPCKFEERYQFQQAECQFEVHNRGERPVRIHDIKAATAAGTATPDTLTIAPGATGYIRYRLDVEDAVGRVVRFVTFKAEGEGDYSRRLIATGFVLSDLDDAMQIMDFGIVDPSTGSSPKTLSIGSHAASGFRVERILETPEWASATVLADGHSLQVAVKPDMPWGPKAGKIKVTLNTPHQKQAWISVSADVRGAIVADSNPHDIGAIRQGNDNEFIITLTHRDGKDFRLGELRVTGTPVKVDEQACTPAKAGCRQIRARLPKDMPLGPFSGFIEVEFPEYRRNLAVRFGGLLASKTAQIRNLNEEIEKRQAASSQMSPVSSATAAEPKLDLSKIIKSSVDHAESPMASGTGPLLKWQVANEQQLYGYMIYRSDGESGPFVRVNPDTILVASDGSGWKYQWRDNTATSGQTYWYYVATVNLDGKIQPLSGAQKVVAK